MYCGLVRIAAYANLETGLKAHWYTKSEYKQECQFWEGIPIPN
jgi:hypothetical protein